MTPDAIYEVIKVCLTEGLLVTAPMALMALVLGVGLSLLQTITSIQEATLSFVPKLLASAALVWVLAPWMLEKMGALMILFFERAGNVMP